jgi:hypothetical protein
VQHDSKRQWLRAVSASADARRRTHVEHLEEQRWTCLPEPVSALDSIVPASAGGLDPGRPKTPATSPKAEPAIAGRGIGWPRSSAQRPLIGGDSEDP